MAEENILTLVSKKYAETNFIEQGKYTELENQVRKNTTSISDLGNTVATVKGNVDTLTPKVENIENDVKGNKQAITLLEQDVDKKQDQLTPENAGDNITITGEGSTLKINANGGGGETKAKAWLCTRNGHGDDLMCDYQYLEQYVGSDLESVNYINSNGQDSTVFDHQIAKVVFKEEKSIAEVSQWLNFEAKILNGSSQMCSDLPIMAFYGLCAVCPWPDNVPWPEAN